MKKVLYISSMGGHLTELLQLEELFSKYDSYYITEKTKTTKFLIKNYPNKTHYLLYGTKHHILTYPFILLINCFLSLYWYLTIKPDVIITTGAHTAGPMCCLGKIYGTKIIYIETFANIHTKTITGTLISKFSDHTIVQWEDMLKQYPNAILGGWIFK